MKKLQIGNVAPGMALPELSYTVTATRLIAGAIASRDYSPLHHDKDYVVGVVGQENIFANTQYQASLFERYLNDWSGPLGRVARMKLKMRSSVFAGDEILLKGVIDDVFASGECGASVNAGLVMSVGGEIKTTCEVLYALPAFDGDNPWDRRKAHWLQPA